MRLSSNTANNIQGTFSDMQLNHADKDRQEIHKSQEWVCIVRMSRNYGGKQINNKPQLDRAYLKMLLLNIKGVAYRMVSSQATLFMFRKLHLEVLSWWDV